MINMVVFDLDDTLVDTRIFKTSRDNNKWEELPKYINKFTEIGNGKETIDLLIENDIYVIIMTTSRTDYAKEVLMKFDINYNDLFGYAELKKFYLEYTSSKTGALCELKKQYALDSNEILFVGDSYKDYKACEESNIMFLTISESEAYNSFESKLVFMDSYSEILSLVKQINNESFSLIDTENEHIGKFKTLSYYLTDSYKPIPDLIHSAKEDYEKNTVENDSDDIGKTKFSYDAMHKRIKDLKNNKQKSIVNIIRALLQISLKTNFGDIDYVVRSLGSNELEYDKNSISAMDVICFFIACRLGAEYKPVLLKQNKTHDKFSHQKNLNYSARNEIIYKTYSCENIDDDKNILLIDDVITTGATTEEIIRAIKESNDTANIKVFSMAKSEKFTKKNYIKNIVNAQYFTCAHPSFDEQRTYQYFLVNFLKELLHSNKVITVKNGAYTNRLICTKDIDILHNKKDYLFFSIRNNKVQTSKFSKFNIAKESPLYKYNNEFIDNGIESLSNV
ncbi:hypothetical protein OAR97_00995 [Arcobacteraceae bacterium]|nr:hypothetical protein [Arcobacteraceae bacterium]